jgi:cystathionine beta-lyase/cystathionine gamma-synthase
MHPDSIVIFGDRKVKSENSVSPPIYQTAGFSANSSEEFIEMSTRARHDRFYTRAGNPTHTCAEAILAELENAEAALLTSSGMAAITSAMLAHLKSGDHVIGQKWHYPGTSSLLQTFLPNFGVETSLVDTTNLSQIESAIRPNTRVIMLESPANPMMQISDYKAIAKLAQSKNITTIADNTLASSINQKPLDLGIDVTVYSATKYLSGHSDLILGAIVGTKQTIEKIWKTNMVMGSCLNALDSWLLLRGMRTYPMRVRKQNLNAQKVAEFLEKHPKIKKVHYPGLKSHPQHEIAKSQMTGYGCLVSFELKTDMPEQIEKFFSSLRFPLRAPSLGAVDSLIVQPAVQWSKVGGETTDLGIPVGLIRFSCGIEDDQDLVEDFEHALRQV